MTNEEDVEKKKGSMIFSLVSYVSINCIRFTGIISAQSTPTNNGVQSIYFVGEGQGDCNISTHSHPKVAAAYCGRGGKNCWVSTHSHPKVAAKWLLWEGLKVSVSTHSRAEAAAIAKVRIEFDSKLFQHTAARRRLPHLLISQGF